MRLVASAILLVVALVGAPTSAATYVDEPALGHWTMGVALHGGATIVADVPAVPLGIAGVVTTTGYAWESGLSVHVGAGFGVRAADDARSAFVSAAAATIHEWSFGMSVRWTPAPRWDVAPFIELGAHVLLVRAEDAAGQAVGGRGGMLSGKLGARVHLDGFDPWLAVTTDRLAVRADPGFPVESGGSWRAGVAVGLHWDL